MRRRGGSVAGKGEGNDGIGKGKGGGWHQYGGSVGE